MEFRGCCRLWLENSCTAQRGERRERGPVWPDSIKLVQIRWSPALRWLDSAPSLTPAVCATSWDSFFCMKDHLPSLFIHILPDSSGIQQCQIQACKLWTRRRASQCLVQAASMLACLFAGLLSLVLSAVVVGSSAHTAAAADRQESSTPCSKDSHMVSKLLLLLLLLLRFGFVEVRADFPETDMKTQLLEEFPEEIWVMRWANNHSIIAKFLQEHLPFFHHAFKLTVFPNLFQECACLFAS